MASVYSLRYVNECSSEIEREFEAGTVTEALAVATDSVVGGEGLLTAISLSSSDEGYWEFDYGSCEWCGEQGPVFIDDLNPSL